MSGMPVPSWVNEAREQMFKAHQSVDYKNAGTKVRELTPVTCFSTHFAEYELKEKDILVHVFPRGGHSDRWYPESYNKEGTYIPGRREFKAEVSFPTDMKDRIKTASDTVWQGSIAVDEVSELGAYVIQFQDARGPVEKTVQSFVEKFCEGIDKQLEHP